jgi:hypothetical protein
LNALLEETMTRTQKTQIMKVLGIVLIALGLLTLLGVVGNTFLIAATILTGVLILLGW